MGVSLQSVLLRGTACRVVWVGGWVGMCVAGRCLAPTLPIWRGTRHSLCVACPVRLASADVAVGVDLEGQAKAGTCRQGHHM